MGREFGVHKDTIRKVWNDAGISHAIAAKKPKLTPAQKEARVGYASENLTRDWSNVIFSDEKTYQTDLTRRYTCVSSKKLAIRPKIHPRKKRPYKR